MLPGLTISAHEDVIARSVCVCSIKVPFGVIQNPSIFDASYGGIHSIFCGPPGV